MHPVCMRPTLRACGIVAAVENLEQWRKGRCLKEETALSVLVTRTPSARRRSTVGETRPPYPSVQAQTCSLQQEEHLQWRPEEPVPALPLSSGRMEQPCQQRELLFLVYWS